MAEFHRKIKTEFRYGNKAHIYFALDISSSEGNVEFPIGRDL